MVDENSFMLEFKDWKLCEEVRAAASSKFQSLDVLKINGVKIYLGDKWVGELTHTHRPEILNI